VNEDRFGTGRRLDHDLYAAEAVVVLGAAVFLVGFAIEGHSHTPGRALEALGFVIFGLGLFADRYKWVAPSNTTLGMLMATIDAVDHAASRLPDIFTRHPPRSPPPGNSFYLLWMILGFMVVTSVLVVTFGRLGDMYGRVRMYNLGFVVYTFFSLLLTSRGCRARRRRST
jgi:hypothetical protein